MTIQNKINEDIKNAMLNKQPHRLAALRSVKAAFILETSKGSSKILSDHFAENIILKLVKQRKESISIFSKQGRNDLVIEEEKQVEWLQAYLPEQMAIDEVRTIVRKVIIDTGASSLSDIGQCMRILTSNLRNKADRKLISELVKEELKK